MTGLSLIETLRYEPDAGFLRLDLHLARLANSAKLLGLPGADTAETSLKEAVTGAGPSRVRLELFGDGRIETTIAPFTPLPSETVWTVAIAETKLHSNDPLLRHKTSRRDVYDAARAEFPRDGVDEVLLLNEHGALCEGTITSVFLDDGSGQLKTPPLSVGLLAGVLRTQLLCQKKARIERLSPDRIAEGTLYVGNSLRGLIRARLR